MPVDSQSSTRPPHPPDRARPECDASAPPRREQAHSRRVALGFLGEDANLARLTILGVVIEAQQELMRQMLDASGVAWDAREDSKVAFSLDVGAAYARQTRPALAFNQTFEQEFLLKMGSLLSGDRLRLCLERAHHVVALRAFAFRLVSIAAGLCYQLLVVRHRQYPLRLFGIMARLGGGSLEQALKGEKECLFDEWTSAFVERYRGNLDSAASRADLASTALATQLETAQIEAKHSAIRRRLMKASLQTHVQELQHASAESCFAHLAREAHAQQRFRPPAEEAPGRPEREEEPAPPGEKRRRGGGGPWRAFVHVSSAGQTHRPDLAEIGARYRELEQDQLEQLAQLGRLGTRAHRNGEAAFGPSRRDVQRARQKRLRAEERGEASRAAVAALREECFAESRSSQGLAVVPVDAALSSAIAPVGAVGGWENHMSLTLKQASVLDSARRSMETEMARALATWVEGQQCEGEGGHALASLVPDDIAADILPQPSGDHDLRMWSFQPKGVVQVAAQCASVRGELGVGQALKGALLRKWEHRHEMLCHTAQEACTTRRKTTSPCEDAGVCLCSEDGKELRHVTSRFSEAAKELCPASCGLRQELAACNLAYHLVGCSANTDGDEPGPDAGAGDAAAVGAPLAQHFLHVSVHYFNPFRPTFQIMQILSIGEGRAHCRATPVWQTIWEALAALNLDLQWTVKLFRLDQAFMPLGSFSVEAQDYVVVAEPGLASELPFWSGPGDRRRARARRFRAATGATNSGDDDGEEKGASDGGGGESPQAEAAEGGDMDVDDFDPFLESDEDDIGVEDAAGASVADALVAPMQAAPEAPPLPPQPLGPPAQPSGSTGRAGRHEPDVSFLVPGGEIRLYSRTRRFSAFCEQASHGGRCRREKVAYAAGSGRGGQGRPLGYLMAWLNKGELHETQQAHMSMEVVISWAERKEARAMLHNIPGCERVLVGERPRRDDEEDEPESHP